MTERALPASGKEQPKGQQGYHYSWELGRIKPGIDREQLEAYRRNFQIADWAVRMRIPAESMFHNETVETYVKVFRDVHALTDGLGIESATDGVPPGSSLGKRFGAAYRLMESAQAILSQTFTGTPSMEEHAAPCILQDRVSQALSPFGWRLEEERDDFYNYQRHDRPHGLWRETGEFAPRQQRPREPEGFVEDASWWDYGRPAAEQHDPVHVGRVRELGGQLGIAPAEVGKPATHAALTRLLEIKSLVRRTGNPEYLPPALGLDPDPQERLRRVNPLLRISGGLIAGEFVPISSESIGHELERFAKPYGLQPRRNH